MAKKSAKELSEYVNNLDLSDEIKISLMEDITDSVGSLESDEISKLKQEVEDYKGKYESTVQKYKERFYSSEEVKKEEKKEEFKELEEKEVIDIRSI